MEKFFVRPMVESISGRPMAVVYRSSPEKKDRLTVGGFAKDRFEIEKIAEGLGLDIVNGRVVKMSFPQANKMRFEGVIDRSRFLSGKTELEEKGYQFIPTESTERIMR